VGVSVVSTGPVPSSGKTDGSGSPRCGANTQVRYRVNRKSVPRPSPITFDEITSASSLVNPSR
jgi:hypothetical protein